MKLYKYMIAALPILVMASCSDDKFKDEIIYPDSEEEQEQEKPEPSFTERDEKYRPQIHYTPAANWINDPNGMVYADGIWHLYYQYNPYGNDWGNMSWGHAISTDLIHWEEKGVAMTPNQWGDIFSGSAIYDRDNVGGFGAGAILAFYTANGSHQQQCLAYSTDGGNTFAQYDGNPVIPNTDMPDFRDPKVFYHEPSQQYIMVLARGWDYSVDIWGSKNLRNWTKLSNFRVDNSRCNKGQWECPDLIKMDYNGQEKWVMIVSTNPGGPVSGSGTMYFVGDFDGKEFTAQELDYPLWLDCGTDNYAGVTWSNAPEGRNLYIGWMNNWNYAGSVPCNPWRSAMTLPRELTLENDRDGNPVVASKVVKEIDRIAGTASSASDGICQGGEAYEMIVKLNAKESKSFSIGNGSGESIDVKVNPSAEKIVVSRTSSSGLTSFSGLFSIPSMTSPYNPLQDELTLHIFVDKSSVEILSEDGLSILTLLVFPEETYDRITGVDEVAYRPLKSVW